MVELNDTLNNMSYTNWVPYLQMEQPHPLDSEREIKMKPVQEIFDYFKENYPEPFKAFLDHVTLLPYSQTRDKLGQVLDSIRLLKIAKKVKHDCEMMGIKI